MGIEDTSSTFVPTMQPLVQTTEDEVARRVQAAVLRNIVAGINEMLSKLERSETVVLVEPEKVALQDETSSLPQPTLFEEMQAAVDARSPKELAVLLYEADELDTSEIDLLSRFLDDLVQGTPEFYEGLDDPTSLLEEAYTHNPEFVGLSSPSGGEPARMSRTVMIFDRKPELWKSPAFLAFAERWVAFALKKNPGCFSETFCHRNYSKCTPLHVLTNQLCGSPNLLIHVLLKLFPNLAEREFVFRAIAKVSAPAQTPLDGLEWGILPSSVSRITLLAVGYAIFLDPENDLTASRLLCNKDTYGGEAMRREIKQLVWRSLIADRRPEWTRSLEHWSDDIYATFNEQEGVMGAITRLLDVANNDDLSKTAKVQHIVMLFFLVIHCDVHLHIGKLNQTMADKIRELPSQYEPCRADMERLRAQRNAANRRKLLFTQKEVLRRLESTVEVARRFGSSAVKLSPIAFSTGSSNALNV
jgi:hypothetical protein